MQLPLSGLAIDFRAPDGDDEALIAEQPAGRPIATGILLLERLARTAEGQPLAPAMLTLTDFETALAGLRTHLIGPDAAAQTTCPRCRADMELGFSFDALAAVAQPRTLAGAAREGDGGAIDAVRFRFPTAGDARACEGRPDAEARLRAACVDAAVAPSLRRRVERAIARLAPLLSRIVATSCVACGATLRTLIHVPSFVVGELAWTARGVFDDVHLLASAYGWREAEILALPGARRRHYAARVRAG